MRNRFLLQSLCSAIIFLSSMTAVADDAGTGGSIPFDLLFNSVTAEQNAKLDNIVGVQSTTLGNALQLAQMELSFGLLLELRAASTTFTTAKLACASTADTAEMLCIESKSPQAKIAKGIIDAAGPALAAINTAQKTCSATASTTNLAQQAMLLAKGACVAAKLTCDNSCSKSAAQLEVIKSKIKAFLAQAEIDYNVRKAACLASGPGMETCLVPVNLAIPPLKAFQAAVEPAFAAESAPTPVGTMNSLVLRCQGYSKDLALFAANIFGLMQATKSATECANKLASGPTSPTAKEYCAITENASTTFCKCQKDPTAENCAGHVSVAPSAKDTKDGKGNNIKSDGKGNQFAGGFDPVKPTAIDLGGLKPDTVKANTDDPTKPASAANGGPGASSGSPGGPSGGNSASASDAKGSVAGEDKKKMGLGSFLGLGGSSSGSGSGSGKNGNGSLGQKDMDAIQRQIASEKLRAEVSGASGKSNWEKVSERYLRNKSTLLVGQ